MSESALTVSAPTAVSVDFTFSALSPNTTDMQTTITNFLTDYFKNNTNVSSNITLDDLKRIISSSFDSSGNIPTYTLTTPSSDVLIGSELGVLGNNNISLIL